VNILIQGRQADEEVTRGGELVCFVSFCYIFIDAYSKQAHRKDQKDPVQKTPIQDA
jgi:hypothetical protein